MNKIKLDIAGWVDIISASKFALDLMEISVRRKYKKHVLGGERRSIIHTAENITTRSLSDSDLELLYSGLCKSIEFQFNRKLIKVTEDSTLKSVLEYYEPRSFEKSFSIKKQKYTLVDPESEE